MSILQILFTIVVLAVLLVLSGIGVAFFVRWAYEDVVEFNEKHHIGMHSAGTHGRA